MPHQRSKARAGVPPPLSVINGTLADALRVNLEIEPQFDNLRSLANTVLTQVQPQPVGKCIRTLQLRSRSWRIGLKIFRKHGGKDWRGKRRIV